MRVNGEPTRPLRSKDGRVFVIDQRQLPHRLQVLPLDDMGTVRQAIAEMWVRGAPLIGATAAYGMALQAARDATDSGLQAAARMLQAARPTAVNLAWAVNRVLGVTLAQPVPRRAAAAWAEAEAIAEEDVAVNAAIGRSGLPLIEAIARTRPGPVRVLTHCNAGWLATVDWGTATAPIYQAHAAGMALQVWVDETRPRNQGASLTAWELGHEGVPHTVIADNAGGHLMQRGQVDLVIVGCDRVTARGDACNKIGTYLKALAARDNGVPFYVAMPTSTLDLSLLEGKEVPIEERPAREVTHITGRTQGGQMMEVQLTPKGSGAANPAFDVTPARLVTGFITEKGVVPAEEAALRALKATGA